MSSGVTEQAQIPDEVLVVDLDGTLLRSDMLYESFWASFGSDWRSPFVSAATLLKGRASLKRVLANRATIDAAHLPYDPHVLDYIGRWREKGGKTALVTVLSVQCEPLSTGYTDPQIRKASFRKVVLSV